jgi:hypothetical protein
VNSAREAIHATSADQAIRAATAANAEQLGGATAASFLPSSRVRRVDHTVVLPSGSQDAPLLSMGPLSLSSKCVNGPSTMSIEIYASSSAEDTILGWAYTRAGGEAEAGIDFPIDTPSSVIEFSTEFSDAGAGEIVYSDDATAITLTFNYFVSAIGEVCILRGIALEA